MAVVGDAVIREVFEGGNEGEAVGHLHIIPLVAVGQTEIQTDATQVTRAHRRIRFVTERETTPERE